MNKIRLFFILLLVTFCFYLVGCENVNRPIEEPDIQEDIHKVEEPDTQEDIHKESEGLVFSLAYDGLGYSVDGIGTCTDRNLIIPNEYDGLPVIEISKRAFENCYQLISVTFPEEMLSIDQSAFAYCSNLERAEFNEKLNRIDDHAFENCALKSIRIPDSVTFIGGNAFCGCRDISHVYIGSGLCSWSNFSPFGSCNKIVEVINKSQMEIKAEDNVWEMTVTPNVKQIITDEAKSNIIVTNDGLVLYNDNDKVYLVNYIGNETTIIIPNNVTDIYKYAFYGYSHIAKVIIGEGVKTIGECAFENSSIASVTIPNSIEEIHNSAFRDARNLVEIINHSNFEFTLGSYDYGYIALFAKQIINDEKDSKVVINKDKYVIYDNTYLVNYVGYGVDLSIPEGIETIGRTAFYMMGALKNVTIPDGVKVIEDFAFGECKSIETMSVPNSVIEMGESAFNDCSSLTSFTFPKNIKTISPYLLANCASLKEIIVPDGVTLIKNEAFCGCRSVENIYIPNTVEEIEDDAFVLCDALKSLVIPNSVKKIGREIVYGCNNLEYIILDNIELDSDKSFVKYKKNVFYIGNIDKYNAIKEFLSAKVYLYSEDAPTETGDYWHYVDGVPSIWK